MGGSSSSSNKTENFEYNLTNNVSDDRQIALESGVAGIGGDNNTQNIEILDGGAINSAFDFAKESQGFWGENFNSVLGLVESTNANANDTMLTGQQNIARAFTDNYAIEKTAGASSLMPVLSGGLVIGGLYFIVKALKG